MKSLRDKITFGNGMKVKKDLLQEINEWMGRNFIISYNQVKLPKEPNLNILEAIDAELPVLAEFRDEQLTGNHYLIASILSLGIEIGKQEKEKELVKEIKLLEARVESLREDKKN